MGIFSLGRLQLVARRFPLSCLCALAGLALALCANHSVFPYKYTDLFDKTIALLICGFFWFGSARLAAESRKLNDSAHYLAGVGVFAAMGLVIFLSPQWYLHLYFIVPALLLLIMVAPFTKDGDDISVWAFNYTTWFGVAVSFVAALILWLGLTAALASIHYLFGVDINERFYIDFWLFAAMLVGPVYALSWVPDRFVFSEDECRAPSQISFLIHCLLVPLVFLYTLILYAYLVKIVVLWEIPKGQLSYIITGFGGAGIVTYLAGWPLRQDNAFLRVFYRYFFPVLLVPAGMLCFAIGERVHAYGVTEQRYLLVLAAVWFTSMAVVFSLQKLPLRTIPGLLTVLFVLGSFGPWGGVSVSEASQFSRLEALFVKNGLLKDGQAQKATKDVPFEDRQNISSIMDYFSGTKRLRKLQPWFAGQIDKDWKNVPHIHELMKEPIDEWDFVSTIDLLNLIGVDYVNRYQNPIADDAFSFYTSRIGDFYDVRGFDYMFNNIYSNPGWPVKHEPDAASGRPSLKIERTGEVLEIKAGDLEPLKIDLSAFIMESKEKYRNTQPPELVFRAENPAVRAVLNIKSMTGSIKDGKPKLENLQFDLMLDVKGQ